MVWATDERRESENIKIDTAQDKVFICLLGGYKSRTSFVAQILDSGEFNFYGLMFGSAYVEDCLCLWNLPPLRF